MIAVRTKEARGAWHIVRRLHYGDFAGWPSRLAYAFVGLERAKSSAVAVFDVTNPYDATFIDMIVTPGDLSPEGLAAFAFRGNFYLAIANEVPARGATTTEPLIR